MFAQYLSKYPLQTNYKQFINIQTIYKHQSVNLMIELFLFAIFCAI